MEWHDRYLKLFLSHLAAHKDLATAVSIELQDFGIDAFVAHEDIDPTRQWQDEIEEALQTCDAAAVFLHTDFNRSAWTDQEVGYCLARGVLLIPLRFDINPYGFLGRYQAAACTTLNPAQIADTISRISLSDTRTKQKAEDGLIAALADSPRYVIANERAKRMQTIEDWSSTYRQEWLTEAAENPQVQRGYNSQPIVEELLASIQGSDAEEG